MRYDRWTALLSGLLAFLLLHLLFVAAWDRAFASAPWPGYEATARAGLLEPWFVNSPRSLWLARAVFFLLAAALAFARDRARWRRAALLWAGAAIGVAATYATTRMPALPAGALGFLLYPFRLLLPVVLGTALAGMAQRALRGRRPPDGAPAA